MASFRSDDMAGYGAMNDGSEKISGVTEPSKESPISQAMSDMEKQIRVYSQILQSLRSRLDPIIRKSEKEEEVRDEKPEERRSGLCEKLNSNVRQIRILNSEIESIIDRLDI